MKPDCSNCLHMYCCEAEKDGNQCPISPSIKPASEPFDKEFKPAKPYKPTWDSLEGMYR